MGFYGSVYYQLIDTFYRMVVKNEGKTAIKFPDSVSTDELIVAADGRKGIIDVNTGNRWLAFTKDGTKFKLWHTKADTTAANLTTQTSFVGAGPSENKTGGNDAESATQLNYGDTIAVESLKYDKAGHISNKTKKFFVLPQELVNYKVDAIEELLFGENGLGEKENIDSKIQELQNKLKPNESILTILDYIIKNYGENEKYHKQYLGDWTKVCDNWSSSSTGKPTVTKVIGDLDNLFQGEKTKGYTQGKTYHPSLVSCIGDMSTIAKDFSSSKTDATACSISEALHTVRETMDSNYEHWEGQNAENETAIQNLQTQQNTLNDGLSDFRSLTNTNIDLLKAADQAEKEAREAADATLTTNLNKEIGDREAADATLTIDLNKEISDREKAVETLTTNLNKEIGDREEAIGTIHTILGNKGDSNDSVYVEIGKLHTKDGSIDADIQTINNTIGPAEGLGSVYEEIRKLQAADTTMKSTYEAADKNIVDTYIGTKPEGWNPLYTEIDNIKNDITTKDTATNARFGEGITVENTVAAHLAELRDYADKTFATQAEALTQTNASSIYLTRTEANDTYAKTSDYVSKAELDTSIGALDKYMIKTDLGDNLNTLITSVQTPDQESGQVPISTLEDLLNKIVGMEAEIKRLNSEIESLKTPSTEGTEE